MFFNKRIYDKANYLVNKYQTRNPKEIIENLNIKLIYFNNSINLLGVYNYIKRNRFIFISPNVGIYEKIILAHELGHDQLHRDFCKFGNAFHENSLFNPTNKFEIEANIFAAHLLIDNNYIFQMLNNEISYYELEEELQVDINLINLKISEMIKLGIIKKDLYIERPDANFLSKYKPQPDEWF